MICSPFCSALAAVTMRLCPLSTVPLNSIIYDEGACAFGSPPFTTVLLATMPRLSTPTIRFRAFTMSHFPWV